jgi:hypothetical protein
MKTVKGGALPLRLVVLSRMDEVVNFEGNLRGKQVEYRNHAEQVGLYTAPGGLVIFSFKSHTDTYTEGLRMLDELAHSPGSILLPKPDITTTESPPHIVAAITKLVLPTTIKDARVGDDSSCASAQVSHLFDSPQAWLFKEQGNRRGLIPRIWLESIPKTGLGDAAKTLMKIGDNPGVVVAYIGGDPGVGKTSLFPMELLGMLEREQPDRWHGCVILMDLKETMNTLKAGLWNKERSTRLRSLIWNGDSHQHPMTTDWIAMTTPESFFYKMFKANSYDDVQHVFFDECHAASSYLLLVLSWFLKLGWERIRQGQQPIKIYLVTATQDLIR